VQIYWGAQGRLCWFLGVFCYFSHEKYHITSSKQKYLKVAEHVHIYVLQHPTTFQAKITRKRYNLKSKKLLKSWQKFDEKSTNNQLQLFEKFWLFCFWLYFLHFFPMVHSEKQYWQRFWHKKQTINFFQLFFLPKFAFFLFQPLSNRMWLFGIGS